MKAQSRINLLGRPVITTLPTRYSLLLQGKQPQQAGQCGWRQDWTQLVSVKPHSPRVSLGALQWGRQIKCLPFPDISHRPRIGLCPEGTCGTRIPDFGLGTILLLYNDFALIWSHPLPTGLLFLIKSDFCCCLCLTYIYSYVISLKINTLIGIYLAREYSKMVNSLS